MTRSAITRNLAFILVAVAALVLKRHYSGPFLETVASYGGNVSASFAVYFIFGISRFGRKYQKLVTAGIALLVVELFEATNGFGVMTNVYDRFDYPANAIGVGLALAIDTAASGIDTRRMKRRKQIASGTGT